MKSTRTLLGLAVVTLTLLGLSSAGIAQTSATFFQPGTNDTTISGDYEFVLVNGSKSGTWSSGTVASLRANDSYLTGNNISIPADNGNRHYLNISIAESDWAAEGLQYINATVWDDSDSREAFNTIWVTVDNSGPTFQFFGPADGANLTSAGDFFNITAADDTYSSVDSATFAFENSSGSFKSDGTGGWEDLAEFNSSRFNETVTPTGLQDGEYTLTFNVSDTQGNTASDSKTVYVDTEGPNITFNSHANRVDATVTDEPWPVADQVDFAINNTTINDDSDLWNGTGAKGQNTTVDIQGDRATYSLNPDNFDIGNYTLTIWADDVNGNSVRNRTYLHIDGVEPTINSITINDTSDRSSIPGSVTTATVFNISVTHSDTGLGVKSCIVDIWDESEWPDGQADLSTDINRLSSTFSTGAVNVTDFQNYQGNKTFRIECGDYGENEVRDRNLTMDGGNGETVAWFPIDNAGPNITNISPANGSYVTTTTPTIEATLEDYTQVDDSSITVWFNGSSVQSSNYSLDGDGGDNTTIDLSYETATLEDGTEYNFTINASDGHGFGTGNLTYNFTVDATAPTIDSVTNSTSGGFANDETGTPGAWYSGDIDFDMSCTDSTSGVDEYGLSDVDDSDDIGSGGTDADGDLTYALNDGEFEEEGLTLELTCSDEAGNVATTERDVNIDTQPPEIFERTPSPDSTKGRDTLPYDNQNIRLEVEDTGSGFDDGTWYSDYDPTFDDEGIGAGDDEIGVEAPDTDDERDSHAYIRWTQDDIDEGTHDISLGSSFEVEDAVGNTLEISQWSYEVSLNTEQQEDTGTQTTSTDANLDITNAPSSVSVIPGRQMTLDLTIENDGDSSADADIDADSDDSDLSVSVDPTSADIDAGDTRALDLELDPNDVFSGTAEVTLEVTYGGNSDTITIDVDANQGSPDLTITEAPDEIDVWNNGTGTSVSVSVENTGRRQASGLEATVTGFSVDADQIDVPASETTATSITVSTEDRDVGTYTETLRLSNDDRTVSQQLEVKVQPADADTRNNITLTISSLGSQVSEIQDTETRNDLQELVSDAQSAIADEDYARAASLRDQIRSELQSAETDSDSGGGLPILPILAVLGIAALAAGALAYIFLIRPEQTQQGDGSGEDTTSVEFGETGSRIEHIGKTILQTTEAFIDAVERAIGNIIDSISGDDTDEDDSDSFGDDGDDAEIDRKKIRFDDV